MIGKDILRGKKDHQNLPKIRLQLQPRGKLLPFQNKGSFK